MSTLALVLLVVGAASAQDAELRVQVTLEDGSAIPGAFVVVRDVDGTELDTRVADGQGRAHFPAIPAGPVSVTTTLEGFETSKRLLEIEPGDAVDLPVRLITAVLGEEIVVTDRAPVVGTTDASISDPNDAGVSWFCLVSPAIDDVTLGTHLEDGSLVVEQVLEITFPSNCEMNRAGTRAWVGNRAENRILTLDRIGTQWTLGSDVVLDGSGLGGLSVSPSEDHLLARLLGSVSVFRTTSAGLESVRSVALDSVRRMAALDGFAYAITDHGVHSFSYSGNDSPQLVDEVDGAFRLAPFSNDGVIVAVEDEFRLHRLSRATVRLGEITSRPGDIVNARRGVPYAGTRRSEPIMICKRYQECGLCGSWVQAAALEANRSRMNLEESVHATQASALF